jgi:hypothetical protein
MGKNDTPSGTRRYDIKNSVVSQRIVTICVLIAGGSSASLSIVPLITQEIEPYLFVAAIAFAAVMFVLRSQPVTTLGADGIYTRWMNRTHYIPISDIQDVMHTGEKPPTLQVLTRKEAFKNALVKFQGTASEISRFADDLNALRKSTTKTSDDVGADKFARGKLRVADWVAGVRTTIDARGGHYRAATIPRERALEYVQDTTLPTDVRAGAAVALAEHADPAEKQILVRVAESCASPALRRVFQSAADGGVTEAELQAMLDDASGPDSEATNQA